MHIRAETLFPQREEPRVALAQSEGGQFVRRPVRVPGGDQREGLVHRMQAGALLPHRQEVARRQRRHAHAGIVKLGSDGSVTASSRSQPSFSSLMC